MSVSHTKGYEEKKKLDDKEVLANTADQMKKTKMSENVPVEPEVE